ncbi:hypothetical protein [Halopiger goleimassiliensis]|uniref:hypothetical protein n=1 Tax=Halopiger goleimassiliensis TaxID=1293048 RepID=UPI0012B5DB6A|nr:hypothetical protein [Halopiger goleimassiliensis]
MRYDFVESDQIKQLDAEYTTTGSPETRRQLADALAENAIREFEHGIFGTAGKEMRERLAQLHEEADGETGITVNLAETLEAEVRHNFERSPSTNPLPPSKQRQRVADLLDLAEECNDGRVRSAATVAVEGVIEDYRLPELSNNRLRVEVDELDATIELFERIVELNLDVDGKAVLSEMQSHRETAKQEAKKAEIKSHIFNKYVLFLLVFLPPVFTSYLGIMMITGHSPAEIFTNYLTYNLNPAYRVGEIAGLIVVGLEFILLKLYFWYRKRTELDKIRNQYL